MPTEKLGNYNSTISKLLLFLCVRHCHLVIYRSKECLRVGGQTIKTLLENSFGVHLFHLLIHSWHPNHQNISNPRKKNWRNFVYFLSFAWFKSRTKCCRFLLMISWRYLKIHFTASLKKLITWNLVTICGLQIFWWFGCHECTY